jgi:hypothetical protein
MARRLISRPDKQWDIPYGYDTLIIYGKIDLGISGDSAITDTVPVADGQTDAWTSSKSFSYCASQAQQILLYADSPADNASGKLPCCFNLCLDSGSEYFHDSSYKLTT